MNKIDFLPNTPILSRYSAPWDADCWYHIGGNIKNGSCVSSNYNQVVKKIKGKYVGAEYIVTYDSFITKKIDHQENDFYVEKNCEIYVAADSAAVNNNDLPSWFSDWTNTGDTIQTSETVYNLFSKSYSSGDHVVIPAFEGQYHNYFILALSNEKEGHKQEVRRGSTDPFTISSYEHKVYKNHLAYTFNNENYDSIFDISGNVTLVESTQFQGKKQLRLTDKTIITYNLPPSNTIIDIKTSIEYREGMFEVYGLKITNGKVYCNEKQLTEIPVGEICTFRFILNKLTSHYYVYVNNIEFSSAYRIENFPIFYIACLEGAIYVQNLYVSDYTDENVYFEFFAKESNRWVVVDGKGEITDFPFKENKSFKLSASSTGSCEYIFPKLEEKAYIEHRLFISGPGFTSVSVTDEKSNIVCTAAFYKNNLFASSGDEWEKELGYVTPHSYYPSGNWYDVKFIVDIKNKCYSLFVDGAKVVNNNKFASPKIKGVCKTEFSFTKDSDLYVNYAKIYEGTRSGTSVIDGLIYDVKRYGARGDGKTNDMKAIQSAIDACQFTGGTVYIHDGIFLTGELKLKSDMTLFIDESAVLLGTQNHGDYPLRIPSRSLCANRQLGRGLLYGDKVTNITIKGGGMLDGNGKYRFKENDPVADRRALDARPDIIYIAQSNNITIEDVCFRRSAFWTVVPLSSKNITINRLYLDCQNTPNRDGIDPVDCMNITISNCNIMAGDDGICFKSSDIFGCENISVYNCMIQSLASAIKFGTDTYYSLKNAQFSDCFIKNVNRCAVSLESVDGADVNTVRFIRLDCTDCAAPAYVVTGSRNRLPREVTDIRTSQIKNVLFKNINARNPRIFGHPLPISEVMVVGESENQMIENITFSDCTFEVLGGVKEKNYSFPPAIGAKYPEFDRHGLSSGYAFTFANAKGISVENVKVIMQDADDIREMIAYYNCK